MPCYQQNNPCSCIYSCTPCTTCTTSTCMRLGNIVVEECNSVGPCGQVGSVSFTCFQYNCTNIPTFSVYSISDPSLISVVSIDAGGLVFQTSNSAIGGERVEIVFHASCDGCTGKSDYGSVVIYIQNMCKGITCPAGQVCQPCTGLCAPGSSDLNVTKSATSYNSSGGLVISN